MFISTIDPILFSLGSLEIRWYGVIYMLGFVIGLIWLEYLRKTKELKVTKDDIYDFIFYFILAVVIGARLFEVFVWYPGYYLSNPFQIFAVWKGGLSFHGGLVGAIAVTYWFCKKKKISLWKMADILVIPAVFALALGRIGNFINGELYGPVTNASWCVEFPNVEGCRHPYQIYSFLKRTVIGVLLIFLYGKKKKDGFIFWLFIFLMGLGRFLLDFVREDILYFGFSTGQWLSLIMVVIGAYMLVSHYFKND